MRRWVKICGITRVEDAEVAIAAGADALGINFYASSPRYCERRTAAEIVARVGDRVTVFGLFVNASREEIAAVIRETGISGVQLHGDEPADLALGWELPVLRACRVTSREVVGEELQRARGYRLLLDRPRGGGSGSAFDDELVVGLDLSGVIVAGGLTAANVAKRVRRLQPFGVDVSSGVESGPGVKDSVQVREFVRNAKSAG